MRKDILGIALFFSFAIWISPSSGSIEYHSLNAEIPSSHETPGGCYISQNIPLPLSFDSDLVMGFVNFYRWDPACNDCHESSQFSLYFRGLQYVNVAAVINTGDLASNDHGIRQINAGETIGPDENVYLSYPTELDSYWAGGQAMRSRFPNPYMGRFYSHGTWTTPGISYIGVAIPVNAEGIVDARYADMSYENVKYGWVRIYTPQRYTGDSFYVYDYAFETTPNTPILAGAVPEPITLGMLLLGGLTILRRRK